MAPKTVRVVIPVVLFFSGLSIIFVIGIGKFPKRLGSDLAGLSSAFQRKISSHSSSSKSGPEAHEGQVWSSTPAPAPRPVEVSLGGHDGGNAGEHDGDEMDGSQVGLDKKGGGLRLSPQDHQAHGLAQKNGVCQSFELRGEGVTKNQVTPEEWGRTVKAFHHSKEILSSWLKDHAENLSKEARATMEKRVSELKIVQPVHASVEEPDLSWRGIGVWVRDDQGAPMLLMGGGFLKLMELDSKRASFEMTRLVAQSWSPCELAHSGVQAVWSPLLKCLGEVEEKNCSAENSSENTWGVSSSLAAYLDEPKCQLPVFTDEKRKACLHDVLGKKLKAIAKTEKGISE